MMTTLFSWILGIDTGPLLIIPGLVIWFGLIIYNIPWKLYLDHRTLKAEQRTKHQQEKDICVRITGLVH
jgi:hypothetical protein